MQEVRPYREYASMLTQKGQLNHNKSANKAKLSNKEQMIAKGLLKGVQMV